MGINVLMNGIGKMGTAVAKRLLQDKDVIIVDIIDPNPSTEEGRKLQEAHGRGGFMEDLMVKKLFSLVPEGFKVMVDFSNANVCLNACLTAARCRVNIVSGTTSIPKNYEDQISKAIAEYGVSGIRCSNFSVDVNKFLKEMEIVARHIDPSEQIVIYEIHRLEKISTSGTAGLIARILCEGADRPGYILLREGKAFDRTGSQIEMPETKKDILSRYIQVSSIRFADEPGTHVVQIGGEKNYRMYRVRSTRSSYAEGAYRAVKFLSEAKERRQYTIDEVLSL